MRFELNADAVMALIRAIFSYFDSCEGDGTITAPYFKLVLMDCSRLIRKVKTYGLEAFSSRDKFREEINNLQETEDALTVEMKKRFGEVNG